MSAETNKRRQNNNMTWFTYEIIPPILLFVYGVYDEYCWYDSRH